jgi:hypothetical protein
MWFFGIITLSKFWVNIAAAKKATARNLQPTSVSGGPLRKGFSE